MSLAELSSSMKDRKPYHGTFQEQVSEESFAWTAFDRAMTEAMYRQHAPFVAGFLARLGVGARYVEDEVLRVFTEVNRRAACVPAAASPRAWVAAVALRGAVERYHLEKLDVADDSVVEEPSIGEFLLTLEPELRAIFVLFELERETSESIAAAFGTSVETVHERLHAGQRAFRRAYGLADAPASTPAVESDDHGLPAFDPVSLV
jgi:RNA polymerase sigma-70 factor (ECF subfamily)